MLLLACILVSCLYDGESCEFFSEVGVAFDAMAAAWADIDPLAFKSSLEPKVVCSLNSTIEEIFLKTFSR